MDKLHGDSETCPHCGANLVAAPIPDDTRGLYGGSKHTLRVIGIYDMEQDMTVAFRCPDCGAEDDRF